ncbi:nucleotidyl transferase AbiEii/AbiGii toxin family protein [Patescibacteria group bacterium]
MLTLFDFSRRETILEPKTSPIETTLPIGAVSLINHLSEREILAEKIRAIYSRKKGRDLFDLWYLLSKKVK